MAVQSVEWVLVIYYGTSAHRATYGRLSNTKYTKDYIQLSRKAAFLDTVSRLFHVTAGEEGSVPLTYKWATGESPGSLVLHSADRPHLSWETSRGAPKAWKMSLAPSEVTAETIPGDPTHTDFDAAENELAMLARRGAGQPYLMAIKLHHEPATLHLRAYLGGTSAAYAWADLEIVPLPIQELAAKASLRPKSALAWETFANGFGLFFDPTQNHNAWVPSAPLSERPATQVSEIPAQGDAAAEAGESDSGEVEAFQKQIDDRNFSVADARATMKTRGSAQRAFADAVKSNYGYRCAITGIETKDFLVASHIVPWSEDQSIRLDPSNGICLSLLMDRAFEKGHLLIGDDLSIQIDWLKVGDDGALLRQLGPYVGQRLKEPVTEKPRPEYLRRRRALFA